MGLAIGIAATVGAIFLLVFLFGTSAKQDKKQASEILEAVGVGAGGGGASAAAPAPSRAATNVDPEELTPLLQRIGGVALKLSAGGYTNRLQRRLDLAGNPPAWPA